MQDLSTKNLQEFINDYSLKKPDGTIAFDALINFYQNGILHIISSEVQVITIPKMMAVYIIEFFKDAYHLHEMYATASFHFTYSKGGALQILSGEKSPQLLVSIKPAGE